MNELEAQADRTELVVQKVVRALRKRRGLINNDPDLRDIVLTVKLFPSSGNLRSLMIDLLSEEKIAQR